MPNKIQFKRSTTNNAVPTAGNLTAGELAINLTNKKLFCGDSAGNSNFELTRLAAASSPSGYLNVQLADTNGYLTVPSSGVLYWDVSNERLVATSMSFGLVDFYSWDNERIMEATGNPSRRIHIRQQGGGEIHVGDSGLQGNTSIGLMVDENNNQIVSYGNLKVEPDVNANTAGEFTVAGATTLSLDLAVNGGDITTTAATASLFNTNCTTLNIGQAATAISVGATTGTTTFRNGIVAPTGTASLAPIKLVAGTNQTTASAGSIEYDGKAFYATTAGGRTALSGDHFAVVTTTRGINSSTTAQAVFDSANDVITLAPSTTYTFEGLYRIASGTTTHTTQVIFNETGLSGGPGTWYWFALTHGGTAGSVLRGQDTVHFTSATGGAVNATSTAALTTVWFRGTVTTPSDYDSTVTPQIKFGTAPGGTNQIQVGTFLRFCPVGSNTVTGVGPWS